MEPNASKVAVFPEKDVTSQAERIANFVEGLRFEALGPRIRPAAQDPGPRLAGLRYWCARQ